MNAKLILIFVFSLLYASFEILRNLRQTGGSRVTHSGDKGSLRMLYLMITIGFYFSFTAAATKFGRIYHWDAMFLAGSMVAILGLFIRIKSILILKHYFTYAVAKVEHQQLVTTGLYRFIRHPGYLGQLIIFCGIALALSNWISLLGMMLPVLFGFLYRIRVEEQFMAVQMGDNYIEYQKRTKKLIPLIF